MKRIYVWGAGRRAKRILDDYGLSDNDILGFIDNDNKKKQFMEYQVYSPLEWKERHVDYDYVLISVYECMDIFFQCLSLGIPREKIAFSRVYRDEPFCVNSDALKEIMPTLYDEMKQTEFGLIALNESDAIDDKKHIGNKPYDSYDYKIDYYRYRTFEFVARELQDVPGCVAEFGVFKGVFSALINEVFYDRKLYLFDTFEGFAVDEVVEEIKSGRASQAFADYHKNGSEDETRRRLPNPQMTIIRRGLFPESIEKNDYSLQFAFVSIDVDFEKSTYEGLEFFYPRLSPGGVIFLHDYHTYHLSGVSKAVESYEKNIGTRLTKVPLADRAGTLVIIKAWEKE